MSNVKNKLKLKTVSNNKEPDKINDKIKRLEEIYISMVVHCIKQEQGLS